MSRTKKVAKRAAPKKAARKKAAPRKKAARKKAAPRKKSRAKKAAPKRAAPRKKAAPKKKPRAKKKAPAPPPAFPQRAGATPKQLLLFELMRARASVLSALQGLGSGTSDPIAPGKWSPREIVLHLVTRDQARLRELESTLHGTPASWRRTEDWAQINETNLAPLRHHDWEEALRLLHRTRQQLVEEIESVPEEPADVWSPEHPFGWMISVLPPHDRHHADQIKRWRASRGA